ncbi:hypothetical protein Q5692_11420 [Microcoleus sp. C2C3]|uniref:hypothetical protein n=1 Tax=unclassified Microcoleus TaxID=2642155 RepID=UPI002FD6387E
MPVPQENLSFVEQASCLLLTMVQDISLTRKTNYLLLLSRVGHTRTLGKYPSTLLEIDPRRLAANQAR